MCFFQENWWNFIDATYVTNTKRILFECKQLKTVFITSFYVWFLCVWMGFKMFYILYQPKKPQRLTAVQLFIFTFPSLRGAAECWVFSSYSSPLTKSILTDSAAWRNGRKSLSLANALNSPIDGKGTATSFQTDQNVQQLK